MNGYLILIGISFVGLDLFLSHRDFICQAERMRKDYTKKGANPACCSIRKISSNEFQHGIFLWEVGVRKFFFALPRAKQAESNGLDLHPTKNKKRLIRNEVMRVVGQIRNEKARSGERTKRKLRSRVYEAYGVARYIYKNVNRVSDNKTREMIIDAIRPLRYDDGIGYFFISSLDDTFLLFPSRPEMEGTNFF